MILFWNFVKVFLICIVYSVLSFIQGKYGRHNYDTGSDMWINKINVAAHPVKFFKFSVKSLFKPLSCWSRIYPAFANNVDPDQLASEEANWSGSTLFVMQYMNLYKQSGSSNLVG